MRKHFLLALVCISCIACSESENHRPHKSQVRNRTKPQILSSYLQIKSSIDDFRKRSRNEYLKTAPHLKSVFLSKAGDSLVKIIGDDFYQRWKGTPWDFNGTTKVPRKGTIACGYFVTGLLQDAGYRLNRVKLSTCPSLVMMKELTSSLAIKNYSALTFAMFVNLIKQRGKALYIAGLDFHTGFIVNDGKQVWLLHSNYINKEGVIKESIEESAAFKASKTRWLTCLSQNEKFLTAWLLH